jgi:hydrogenase/urease accessory protein HupE
MRAHAWALAILTLGLLGPANDAEAHQQSATFGEVARREHAREIVWRLRVRASDLAVVLHAVPGGAADPSVWRARAAAYLAAGLRVAAGGQPCVASGWTLIPDLAETEPTWAFDERFECPAADLAIRLQYELFFEADRFHQSFTRLALGAAERSGSSSTVVFRDGLRDVTVGNDEEPSVWRSAAIYLRLGIIHILTGYDHLSFLMALLLGAALCRRTNRRSPVPSSAAAASVRQALAGTVSVISAFTVAHSLTLILQVLRPGWISTRWVEPAIALSVAYVGFENLVPRPPRRRWLLVFGFGLVHGLGFASVLREIGLPRRGLVLSLLSFNLGVEIGQLMVLAVTFPLIVGAARRDPRRFERWGLQLGSGVIAAFGTVWLVLRLASPR